MKQRLLTFLFTLLCIMTSASAIDYDFTYTDGSDTKWYLKYLNNKTEVAVTCRYDDDRNEIAYKGDLTIPSQVSDGTKVLPVTRIGYKAFYECSYLTSIIIPESVTEIGNDAFIYCSSLTNITIPNSVTTIRLYAFSYCTSLTSITIPNSVTWIEECAFLGCYNLTNITIPNSVTTIRGSVFYGCSSLTSVTIPKSVTEIGDYAFRGCSSLMSITIPNSITRIGKHAFENCSSLTSITIPKSVTKIEYETFLECTSLTSITIPESVTTIESYAFGNCSSLTSITIPKSVTTIGGSAFRGCSSLTNIKVESGNTSYDSRDNCNAIIKTASNTLISGCMNTFIPESVTEIGDYAFNGRSSLTSITIPNTITKIEDYAFEGCSSLTSITIPESVTSIGYKAFSECSKLETMIFEGKWSTMGNGMTDGRSLKYVYTKDAEPTDLLTNPFGNVTEMTLYVPQGSKTKYENCLGWWNFGTILEWDTTSTPTKVETTTAKRALLISTAEGRVRVKGLEAGEKLAVYSLGGMTIDSKTATGSEALLNAGGEDVVIVKVGKESIKLVVR